MIHSAIQHDLLYGILAVQMDFITREDLAQAASTWAADKSQPLDQVLLNTGMLAADEHMLVSAAVRKRLERHHHDAFKHLAAAAGLEDVCKQLQHLVDADVEAKEVPLLKPRDADPYATEAVTEDFISTEGIRYRKLRLHAKGGLGEIWAARDHEVPREVALKEIQPRHADRPESRDRFLLEAKITGALEHPGVVPVHGLGQYADGRPFYAMRFIAGVSLREAIGQFHQTASGGRLSSGDAAQRNLEFRKLLANFIDVCNVMEYAHSRHIIHRDLKPDNIMLGQYGETLVVDWGLAKQLATSDYESEKYHDPLPLPAEISSGVTNETWQGAVVGTPAFMSPEQADGRLDLLNRASDIYSLGATLYSLLTGENAFRGGDVLSDVRQGNYRRPREVNRNVPAPLESICLKAMAQDRQDRYPSANALARDIENWLADEPVSVHPEHWRQRLARWSRRHKAWTQAAAAALLAITVVAVLAMLLVNNARRQQLIAKEEATRMFSMARGAADSLLTGVSEGLDDVPGAQETRRRLLEKAADSYEQFVTLHSSDPGLQAESGWSYLRLAEVRRSLGDLRAAQAALDSAATRFQQLHARQPRNTAYQYGLATSYTEWGRVASDLGESGRAEQLHLEAVRRFNQLVRVEPSDPEFVSGRAASRINLGVVFSDMERYDDAERAYRRAIADLETLVETEHDSPRYADYQFRLARSYLNLGFTLSQAAESDPGKLKQVVSAYRKAIKYLERLVTEYPGVSRYQELLAQSQANLGDHYIHDRQQAEKALAVFQAAVDFYDDLVQHNPRIPAYRAGQIGSRVGLGAALGASGDREREGQAYLAAIRDGEGLLELNDYLPRFHLAVAKSWYALGNFYSESQRSLEALQAHTRAVEHAETAFERQGDLDEYRDWLRNARERRYRQLLVLERPAIEILEEFRRYRNLWCEAEQPLIDYYAANYFLAAAQKAHDENRRETAFIYGEQALELCSEAIGAGYRDIHHFQQNEYLDVLRGQPVLGQKYRELLDRLEAVSGEGP